LQDLLSAAALPVMAGTVLGKMRLRRGCIPGVPFAASTAVLMAALASKAIGWTENPLGAFLANPFPKVCRPLALTRHPHDPQPSIFSTKVSPPADAKKIPQDDDVEVRTARLAG
jgi:hypothetical protein